MSNKIELDTIAQKQQYTLRYKRSKRYIFSGSAMSIRAYLIQGAYFTKSGAMNNADAYDFEVVPNDA